MDCRATPGASQGTPWEWKGYRKTSTDKQTDRQTYTDKQTDRQSYATNGVGGSSTQSANSGSLLETLATFITPVLCCYVGMEHRVMEMAYSVNEGMDFAS